MLGENDLQPGEEPEVVPPPVVATAASSSTTTTGSTTTGYSTTGQLCCYFDISIGTQEQGRIVFKLYDDLPKTTEK
jgi:hypothetical protein